MKKKRKPRRELLPNVVEMATPKQRRFIKYFEKKLGWQDNPERLKGLMKRIIKRDGVRTKSEASKMIEGLKNIANRNAEQGPCDRDQRIGN